MSVEFEEEQNFSRPTFTSRVILGAPQQPAMVNFLYKNGLVKNEKQAGYFLITLIVLSIVGSVFFIWKTYAGSNTHIQPSQEYLDFMHRPK